MRFRWRGALGILDHNSGFVFGQLRVVVYESELDRDLAIDSWKKYRWELRFLIWSRHRIDDLQGGDSRMEILEVREISRDYDLLRLINISRFITDLCSDYKWICQVSNLMFLGKEIILGVEHGDFVCWVWDFGEKILNRKIDEEDLWTRLNPVDIESESYFLVWWLRGWSIVNGIQKGETALKKGQNADPSQTEPGNGTGSGSSA